MLQAQIEPPLYQQTQQLAAAAQSLSAAARLPLVDLAIPALKKSSPQQYAQFRQVVEALVDADGKVDLFEYCLRMVLFSYLDVHFGLKKPPAIRYRTISAVAQPAAVVLSTLAYVGQKQPEDIQRAFQAGAQNLLGQAALVPAAAMHAADLRRRAGRTGPGQPERQAADDRRRDGLHRRRRPGDAGGERAAAGHRRRAGVPRAAGRGKSMTASFV